MKRLKTPLLVCLTTLLVATGVAAEPLTGVCPDGSMFIVQKEADIPCSRARLVESSEMPPIRPELLPRPYTWMVDEQSRNPNNPYNLIDAAEKIREAREAQTEPTPSATPRPAAGPDSAQSPRPSPLVLEESEIRDLARLVILRQEVAPASLVVADVRGREHLRIHFAHSESFETRVLERFGRPPGDATVIAFTSRALTEREFYPNFFAVQGPTTFRPDPEDPAEGGLLLGAPGPQSEGSVVLGYIVLPAHFDARRPMDLWWNDLSTTTTLNP